MYGEKTDMSARYNSHEYDEPAREWLQKMADQFDALSQSNVVELGVQSMDDDVLALARLFLLKFARQFNKRFTPWR